MLYLGFIIGLVLLAVGGDTLVNGSVALARRFHVSVLLIGIVLVGFGTSTPELVASLVAVFQKPPAPGIAIGNVVGSNIANILLVLGTAAVILPVLVDKKSFRRDAFFLTISTAALVIASVWGVIGFVSGVVLVALLLFYVLYSYRTENQKQEEPEEKILPVWKGLLMAVGGIAMTLGGAKLLVSCSIKLAQLFGVSETVIGLTVVAIGTSLPELATSVSASLKKQNDLAFGNVVGSTIYNALFIPGTVALFAPIHVPKDISVSLAIMVFVTLLLIGLGFKGKISRVGGWVFLGLYAGYMICLAL